MGSLGQQPLGSLSSSSKASGYWALRAASDLLDRQGDSPSCSDLAANIVASRLSMPRKGNGRDDAGSTIEEVGD